MKRNLNVPLRDLEGKPYEDAETLRDLVYLALKATLPPDEKSTIAEKAKIFSLAMRCVQGGVIEVDAPELKTIIDRLTFVVPNPIVCSIAVNLLEQDYVAIGFEAVKAA